MKNTYQIITAFILFTFVFTGLAEAIPAFARKYNMSCNVCHRPFPRLKAFGEDFAGNGFQIKDKEPARFYKKTGDDLLTLMRELPVALRFELFGEYNNNFVDFKTPWILKLMSGGNIYKDISYYFYFFISEKGELAGIEDAFISFNDVFKSGIGITAGQFQASDPLFKRELRLEREDYEIYKVRPGSSLASLSYDRGLVLSYTAPTSTDLSLQILNGNGIKTTNVFDSDKYKNFMFRVSQDVNKYFRIGAFGYYGLEKPDTVKNEVVMSGIDLTAGNQYLELNAQYVYRRDTDPQMTGTAPGIITQGGFAEVIVTPQGEDGRWQGHLLYNKVDSDLPASNYESYTGGIGFLLARNIRLIGEYTYLKDSKDSKFSVGIISAF